jgi:hypothetical protein
MLSDISKVGVIRHFPSNCQSALNFDPLSASNIDPSIGCPPSKHLGLLSLFYKEGSGSSRFDVKPLGVDGSSGVSGWSVS